MSFTPLQNNHALLGGDPMKVFIIGGTHFIGPHVIHYLFEAGHEVMVFHRGQTPKDF